MAVAPGPLRRPVERPIPARAMPATLDEWSAVQARARSGRRLTLMADIPVVAEAALEERGIIAEPCRRTGAVDHARRPGQQAICRVGVQPHALGPELVGVLADRDVERPPCR